MAFINEQAVNAELFKVDYRILALGIIELVELCFDTLAGFHKLLDRELFAFGSLHIFDTSFYIKELFFQLHFLAFHAHRDFFKLTVSDDDRIIIACSNASAELLAVARFKILFGRDKDIGARIEPQIFGSPLTDKGIPAEQIRFIHEATTDAQKKELFAKVRSGEVRVLLGSTPKMGAGTNVQDRLKAIHNLDCPWRPSDLEQRQGRIERQGNMFPEVEVYRYVTEQTFDAYLYQLVESKQKFISQIMTSKSPVRSAEDVDEVALSFAEVKMLATGDERFKEKMDLDIQVSKLRVLKQSYLSEHYDLEDRILKFYPQTIKEYEERIAGYESDTALAEQHKPQGEDKFCPMTIKGVTFTEKAAAGEMLLAVCKENTLANPVEIGSYRGFRMEVYYDTLNTHYCLNLY